MEPPTTLSAVTETTLDLVPVGARAAVVRVGGEKAVRLRLMEMGLVRGEQVRVQRAAPLGDPIALRVKGYDLALRRRDARAVVVRMAAGADAPNGTD
jgi:ferrous iron transport protein A